MESVEIDRRRAAQSIRFAAGGNWTREPPYVTSNAAVDLRIRNVVGVPSDVVSALILGLQALRLGDVAIGPLDLTGGLPPGPAYNKDYPGRESR